MLQTVPRVPVAGIKRRWGNRHAGSLQESSPEVSSSGVLSPPPNFQPSTPESAVVKSEELQLWDLDLHRGLQTNGDHYRATITCHDHHHSVANGHRSCLAIHHPHRRFVALVTFLSPSFTASLRE
ncbi:ecdysone receptor B1 isoform [Apis mellifera carnica]|nr:ecdysone receptor B1 isoform [Apis mellifera carnica]